MKLTIKDRLTIIGMLPQEGTLMEMTDIYDLVRNLKLTDKEKLDTEYKEEGQNIIWNQQKDPNRDIQITSDQKAIFMKAVDNLDKEGKISLGQIETILKIKNG